MEPFSFEHTHQLSETEYVTLTSLMLKKQTWRLVRLLLAAALGIACLFWPYTLLLGCAILVLVVLAVTHRTIVPTGARVTFRRNPLQQSPLTYGLNDREFWVRGSHYEARAQWPHLHIWQRKDDWLVLSAYGMPWLFFPLQALEAAGVLERVMPLVDVHGMPLGGSQHRHVEAQLIACRPKASVDV